MNFDRFIEVVKIVLMVALVLMFWMNFNALKTHKSKYVFHDKGTFVLNSETGDVYHIESVSTGRYERGMMVNELKQIKIERESKN